MGLPRSTYYDVLEVAVDEAEIVARIKAIREEFETYGYRRVGAALRHQGRAVVRHRPPLRTGVEPNQARGGDVISGLYCTAIRRPRLPTETFS